MATLLKAGASVTAPPPDDRDIEKETREALNALISLTPEPLSYPSPNGLQVKASLLVKSLSFQASLVADLVHDRRFSDKGAWTRSVAAFMESWMGADQAASLAESVRSHFYAIDKVCSVYVRIIPVSFPSAE